MSNSILYRMSAGIPGDVTRASQSTIEPVQLNASNPFSVFGVPGKIVGGKLVPLADGDAAGVIYGFLVRAYPYTGSTFTAIMGPTNTVGDVLRRGYMTVKLNAGTASKAGQVHVRITAATADKPIGGIEAVADSSNTVALTGATFMGAADASGNVEIAYNI
ncbi:hypothetical protein ACIQVE_07105 [Pseudomonas sp. NPDC098747]|uniref:structural cement protein Gp24 n=1 Tax=Pseudomonas sp. NPDC098747 TaxID=3364487 RepID=UPI00383AA65D